MFKITALVHVMAMPVLMGIFVIAALNIPGFNDSRGILLAAAAGFVVAIPVSWFVGSRIWRARRA
ncbi:hypothetical protein [Notoacmeibacter sp. MSK16QG-6]|uniref:hypothetical protein n=1 Tax=Notoacmeibacter sp. MSK16QG-6 TaxID=2957982 RepID=UPI00209C8D3B|nr:hypothetical protein [Notoacmeibacter sp. MSK16QG-6]MCP1199143.1 hypothetical protein [Notoacmeibacter sp. MSK16QG-6]